ncbi:2Fe-2S iron-sulfur cluster binding domain-containing protein [Shewanella fidelis]|uniref:2Fe-2S iron-sulfur cluster-binding protein n=1 Tax=Shewanella fidelis TaxID=173509 RepID=UPI000684F9BD
MNMISTHKIYSHTGKFVCTAKSNETVLKSLLNANIFPTFSCGSGRCGQCKMTINKGKIEYNLTNTVKEQIDDNEILICAALPKSDLELVLSI